MAGFLSDLVLFLYVAAGIIVVPLAAVILRDAVDSWLVAFLWGFGIWYVGGPLLWGLYLLIASLFGT